MKRKLLVVDTETGGLDPAVHSILSFAAVIYQDGGVSGMFHMLIREPSYIVEEEAIKVNGLTEQIIDSTGSDPRTVVQEFKNWLLRNELYGEQMLVGHKVAHDVAFLKRLWRLAPYCGSFEEQFGHRHLCTQSAAILLDQAGRINLPGGSASLDNVAAVFGCRRESEKHNALEDALLTAKVLAKIIERVK